MWRGLLILVGCTVLVGCPDDADKDLPATTGSPTTGSPTTGTPTTGSPTTSTGPSQDTTSTTSCTTACEPTTTGTTGPAEPFDPCPYDDPFADYCCDIECAPDLACDVWAQNCPDGEKCVAWKKGEWNGTHCSAVDPNPKSVGEPCTVEKRGILLDDCAEGTVCWNDVCAPQCSGTPDAPMCSPGDTCAGLGASNPNLYICLAGCDPLQQDCAGTGEACYPVDDTFACAIDASGDSGAQGDYCGFINVCDPGLACVSGPACDGCCTAFCQLDVDYEPEYPPSPKCSDPATGCLPWYLPGEAPPGLENLGVCLQP